MELYFFNINIIILLVPFIIVFLTLSPALKNIDKSIIWLNLFNWIPIYFAFLGFQIYLKSIKTNYYFPKSCYFWNYTCDYKLYFA